MKNLISLALMMCKKAAVAVAVRDLKNQSHVKV